MIESVHLLPHGMQIIPGLEKPYNTNFQSLHHQMDKLDINSEYILLITPHGNAIEEDYLVYGHDIFQGIYYELNNSVVDGDYLFSRKWTGDSKYSETLINALNNIEIKELSQKDIKFNTLIQGGNTYPMTLAWGETVPLYYITDDKNVTKILIMSIPRKRYHSIVKMKEELIEIGKNIVDIFNTDISISVVISGDLAHTHTEDGPYGYSDTAVKFDELVQKWVYEHTDSQLERLLELNDTALSCGMAGICILHGMFNNLNTTLDESLYSVPTYFGMIIANWSVMSYYQK